MNDLRDILNKHKLHPRSYQIKNKSIIVTTNNGKFVIKRNTNNYDIYNYLSTRGFDYYPNNYNIKGDNYDITSFIEEIKIPDSQKIEDLISILSTLHYKTSYYQEIDLDEIKNIYEEIKNNIFQLLNYYQDLNDKLDTYLFLSPQAYLLLRNISIFYYMFNFVSNKIDEWYSLIKEQKKIRVSLIHNNISKEHLLINERKYLISWDKSKIDRPIIDIINIYKKYHKDIKLEDLINLYECNNHLDKEEKILLLVYLSLPSKIVLTNDNLNNVVDVNKEIIYLKKVYEYIKNNKLYESQKN